MNSYIKPSVFNLPNPVGLDAVIAKIQRGLEADVTWLECIYGRAILQPQALAEGGENNRLAAMLTALGREITFPMFVGENNEPVNLMPNDNVKAYSFFLPRDPAKFPTYVPGDNMMIIQQPISFICWADLHKINSQRRYKYSEELKLELLTTLKRYYDFELTALYEAHSKVFEGCTITDSYKQFCKPPFWAIRIDANISFNELKANCEI